MTNPTSYTDEQVLEWIDRVNGLTEAHSTLAAILRSLLADRQRLQAEVEALRKYIAWSEYLDCNVHDLIDARATPNETKEAKS